MTNRDDDLLLRALADELSPGERRELSERLKREPSLGEALERLRGLGALLKTTDDRVFAPGFVGRVMGRLASAPPTPSALLAAALQRQFSALAPAAAVVLILLAVLNLVGARGVDRSSVEAALGLAPVTLEAAYSFEGAVYGVQP